MAPEIFELSITEMAQLDDQCRSSGAVFKPFGSSGDISERGIPAGIGPWLTFKPEKLVNFMGGEFEVLQATERVTNCDRVRLPAWARSSRLRVGSKSKSRQTLALSKEGGLTSVRRFCYRTVGPLADGRLKPPQKNGGGDPTGNPIPKTQRFGTPA